jgi:putative hydrolase of the HAD superfamily
MIKAVFFDLYHTLIHYDPPREEVLWQSLASRGIKASPAELRRAIIAGDEFFYRENARKGMSQRTEAETRQMWGKYQAIVLREAGIEPTPELVAALLHDMQRADFPRVLFDDALPAIETLSGRGLEIGLISNVDKDINPLWPTWGSASIWEWWSPPRMPGLPNRSRVSSYRRWDAPAGSLQRCCMSATSIR